MIKKLCLIFSLTAVSFIASHDRLTSIADINATINHISREKTAVVLFAQKTLIIYKRAKSMLKSSLHEHYSPLKKAVKKVLNNIIASDEFSYSINKVTDYQTECIVNQHMMFDDITYDSMDYPIGEKINQELALTFPELNHTINTAFNIFYVTLVNCRGCQLLLEKLRLKEQQLTAEIEALQTKD